VSGGYSANLLIGTVDPLLAGITEEAARFIDPDYEVHPAVNWYFMIGSTFLITAIGTWVTAKIVEPRLGRYDPSLADDTVEKSPSLERLTPGEKRALRRAGVAAVLTGLFFVVLAGPHFAAPATLPAGTTAPDVASWSDAELAAARTVAANAADRETTVVMVPARGGVRGAINRVLDHAPLWGILREPEQNTLMPSPFLRSIVAMIFVFFIVPGVVYGRVVGTITGDRDVIDGMADAMSSMGLYIVLVFFAAQFVAFFKWTNLGAILAVVGADAIRAIGLDNALVFIPFIFMCAFVNLMLGSASAQWAVTAPIFVPMLMSVGYSPEVIQAAYRIGDSTTNIITPMMSYFGLILAFACRYDRKLGIGTLVATMLPYSLLFLLGWIAFFYLWVFGLGLPVGPAAPTYYEFAR
jgi:aminobenzoyl-glutamate transport protein